METKNVAQKKLIKRKISRFLFLSIKYPKVFNLISNLRANLRRKIKLVRKLKEELKDLQKLTANNDSDYDKKPHKIDVYTQTFNMIPLYYECNEEITKIKNDNINIGTKNCSSQTEGIYMKDVENNENTVEQADSKGAKGWNINQETGDEQQTIAEQVKEAAQSALQQSGMVYVESVGMYYDYKTGYYYNSDLGLYYHTDTDCYYYYSDEKQEFVFHSYPDRSAISATPYQMKPEKRRIKKQKNMATEEDESKEPELKRRRKRGPKDSNLCTLKDDVDKSKMKLETELSNKSDISIDKDIQNENTSVEKNIEKLTKEDASHAVEDLEDGECSETDSEKLENDKSDIESDDDASTSTADDETVPRHHPPCMRVIVRETNLPKLKVGNLFLVTKDGGTLGREGDYHSIVIRDHNVSREHLEFKYDTERRLYLIRDLGSKNGTILNGRRISDSQVVSEPKEVVHGSVIQLGETKLLCHIHAGTDTCGHCEPGLVMETQEKEKKVAYTRTCSVQKQHTLELARLKNKYAPEPLMIEDGSYNDRAKARRETVGSSHDAEKTETTDVDTCIASGNKGFKLLEKMGWSKGEGLGKDNQGETEPVPIVSNEGKAGLGTAGAVAQPSLVPKPYSRPNKIGPATLRLASKTKMLQKPAKAFQASLDESADSE